MGFRFRKSFGAGPFRVNLSKSGVGYSVGGKGFRVTKKAGGGTRTTASIPGTGISYVKDYDSKSGNRKSNAIEPVYSYNGEKNEWATDDPGKSEWNVVEFLLCLFLGWAGAHKFYRKQKKLGFLYLFTLGLFVIGWWGDAIKMIFQFFCKKNGTAPSLLHKIGAYLIAFLFMMLVGACNSDTEPAPAPVETVPAIVSTTEATEPVTEPVVETAATTQATEEPTEAPTEATEEATDPTVAAAAILETTPATEETTEPTTEATTEPTTEPTTAPTEPEEEEYTYVLNTNTRKFHDPWCSSADDIKPKNRKEMTATRDEVISRGYQPCKRCNP